MKEIKLTLDWILQNCTDSIFCNGKGDVSILVGNCDLKWVKLGLLKCGVKYKYKEYENIIGITLNEIEFYIMDIEDDAPEFFEVVKALDIHQRDADIVRKRKN